MALCHNCDNTRIEYTSDGSQTDYTFPFEYNDQGDVAVAFFDEDSMAWVKEDGSSWSFKNDTTIKFNVAPSSDQQLIIYRCTDLESLPAKFFPGNSVKAQDLNDNFFVLQSAIEEARCETEQLNSINKELYWNKISYVDSNNEDEVNQTGQTVYGTDRWVCADDKVATTEAICNKIEEEFNLRSVTASEQRQGLWIHEDGVNDADDVYATTGAITERLDPYFQSRLPDQPQYQLPGKPWFDTGEIISRVWDEEAGAWIDSNTAGRRGQRGPVGPTKTIVSPTAPARRDDNSELQNGDFWFDSSSAQIYVYYNDENPDNTRGIQWVQALGSGGTGGSNNNYFMPLTKAGPDIKFNINTLNFINPN
jgi:hypothetical protein